MVDERGVVAMLSALLRQQGGDAYLTEKELCEADNGFLRVYFDQERDAFHLTYREIEE